MKPKPKSALKWRIGFAWVFEKAIAWGPPQDIFTLLGRKPKKFGQFIGVVKGVIPVLPFHVPYMWLKHSEAFKKRRFLRKMGFRRGRLPKEQTTLNRLATSRSERERKENSTPKMSWTRQPILVLHKPYKSMKHSRDFKSMEKHHEKNTRGGLAKLSGIFYIMTWSYYQ